MSISIAITTYCRTDLTIQSFEQVLHDDRVGEVVIVDDASHDDSYEKLCKHFKDEPKVKLYQNVFNLDCSGNKHRAIQLASNDYCILLDSDNVISTDYLDRIYDYAWSKDVIFTPEFAMPMFNFADYSGMTFNRANVAYYVDLPLWETMCNAANFFVNRDAYLDVYDGTIDPVTSDSIYFMSRWFDSGKSLFVCPNLVYQHRVKQGEGHYQTNMNRTPKGFHDSILHKLRLMQ